MEPHPSRQTYQQKLLDPRWQRKRLEILQRDHWTCQWCENTEETLHVHHLGYRKNTDPWEYAPDMLITLCAPCHAIETDNLQTMREIINHTITNGPWTADQLWVLYVIMNKLRTMPIQDDTPGAGRPMQDKRLHTMRQLLGPEMHSWWDELQHKKQIHNFSTVCQLVVFMVDHNAESAND